MTSSIYKMYLDVHNYNSHVVLNAKKGDTGSLLYITLMDGRNHYVITPECYAVFVGKKADGNILYNKCTFFENMVVYEFTPQTTASVGKVACEIKLYGSDDKLLTSAGFTLLVMDTVYDDDEVCSEKEVTALTALVSEATTLIHDVEYKLASGAFIGQKGEKGDRGDTGIRGPTGATGPKGEKGDRGAQGISGVTIPAVGFFSLEVDSKTGNLYCVTTDDATDSPFILEANGNLYYEIKED